MAAFYGIISLREARAYLTHPLLGPRRVRCTRTVTNIEGGSLHEIFGSPDDMKFQSSMTLFALAAADPDSPFYKALDRWCGGTLDAQTLRLLEAGGRECIPNDRHAIMPKQMHLTLDVSWTQVESAWRMTGSWVGRHYPDVGLFEDIARIAEGGLFDMIFFGDGSGIPNTWEGGIDAAVRRGVAWPRLDMSPWITAMSRVTSHVGFGLTYASTFMHPFYVARLLNSLDHITNGRIAFNVISSQRRSDYENYGYDELIDHGERYDRMEEFIAVCKARWSSVDADAFVWDRLNGLVADPAKVRPINHVGRFFKVKGPLSVVQSPQGHPAGFVDHVFGAGKGIRLMAQQPYDMDAALRDRGRDPEQVGIVWATKVIVGETED